MKHIEFYKEVVKQMETQVEGNAQTVLDAADACAKSIKNNRVIHVFGTGHSQMFPMEVFYRAGGLVPVNALLTPHYSLYPRAKLSTLQERIEGFSDEYLSLENTSSKDTMIVISMSGRNASSVDMALKAKEIGMTVIAVTSLAFSGHVSSRHSSGKLLKDVADIVIDIKCIEGDAVLSMEGLEPKFSGTSTVLGMLAMESIMARTIENLVNEGIEPPIYVSSNLDKGDDINKKLIKQYSPLISGL
ncbi:SIS domain-containing protein [Aerococcus urinaeequi]|uniref:SIS domain-containing protein n=1 Tax=Aerococcus urinaeequi TaxID=51665 RepID=UPI00288CF4F3|nr:SIS domain-containing protein [Aerococcus urinaeequi]MDT2762303.1 SIS domain-containing protein [Aerococcus urinaeequi]